MQQEKSEQRSEAREKWIAQHRHSILSQDGETMAAIVTSGTSTNEMLIKMLRLAPSPVSVGTILAGPAHR